MVLISFNIPKELKKDGMELVKKGYFDSLDEIVMIGYMKEITSYKKPEFTLESRANKESIDKKYLLKAHGDEEKAMELYFKNLMEIQKKY